MDDASFEKSLRWYSRNLKVVDKNGKLVALTLNPIQKKLERWKQESFERGEPAFAIVLKARREGVSTWVEAANFRDAREMDHREAIVVAHNEASTRKIFEMTRRFLRHFPDEIETEKSSARSLHFADNDSQFTVQTAGSEDSAARGFTCQALHISEVDYCPDPHALLAATMQTIPDTYPAFVVLESTAAGPGGAMEMLWNRAVEGKSAFVPFFFAWFDDPLNTLPVTLKTLVKYAPDDWKRQNKPWLEALKRRNHGMGIDGPAEPGPSDARSEEILPGHRPGERGASQEPDGGGRDDEAEIGEEGTDRGGRVHGVPEAGRPSPGSAGEVPGEPLQAGRGVFREDDARRGDGGAGEPAGDGRPHFSSRYIGDVTTAFTDSLTEYERGLIEEFNLSYDQVNWLRYARETKCSGSESVRKREYPSRPGECFEAAEGAILDQAVIARWIKEAEAVVPSRGSMRLILNAGAPAAAVFDESDKLGKIEVYEPPRYGHRYVLGIDASNGVAGGDDTVGFMLDVDTGLQVAEYRACIDPDLATDQMEALAIFYNKALVAVETNGGYGMPYLRHLLDRKTVPIYERVVFDKIERTLAKRPGWDTSGKTRPHIFAALREAVRKEKIHIKSRQTLSECRTLHERSAKPVVSSTGEIMRRGMGIIEARPGSHDDGVMAGGIALCVANGLLGNTRRSEEVRRQEKPFLKRLNRLAKARERALSSGTLSPKHVRGGKSFVDEAGVPIPRSRLG